MREMQKRLFHESSPADILTLHCSCQLQAMLEGFFTHFEVLAQSFGSSFELYFIMNIFLNFNFPPTAAVTITAINKHEILSADSQSYFSHILPNCTQSPCSSNVFFLWQPIFVVQNHFPPSVLSASRSWSHKAKL